VDGKRRYDAMKAVVAGVKEATGGHYRLLLIELGRGMITKVQRDC
jgi:hypothetical protein